MNEILSSNELNTNVLITFDRIEIQVPKFDIYMYHARKIY